MSYADIPGWMDYEQLYYAIAQMADDGDTLVEVGSYLGRSVVFLAEQVQARGIHPYIWSVDLWTTFHSPEHDWYSSQFVDQYHAFLSGIRTAGVADLVAPVRADSVAAAEYFMDGSVKFVFIDADHTFDGAVRDIQAWWPKLRTDGVMAGHDYWMPEVQAAVRHVLGDAGEMVPGVSSCWWAQR